MASSGVSGNGDGELKLIVMLLDGHAICSARSVLKCSPDCREGDAAGPLGSWNNGSCKTWQYDGLKKVARCCCGQEEAERGEEAEEPQNRLTAAACRRNMQS
jgi:hypothetical protein